MILVFYLLLWYFVTADVKEASTKNCDLLEPEHQQLLREQLQEDSCLREVEGVEPHEVKRAGNGQTNLMEGLFFTRVLYMIKKL